MPSPDIIHSIRPVIPVAVTFVAPFLIRLMARDENRRETVSFVFASLAFLAVVSMAPGILEGKIYTYTLFRILPGMTVSFCADGLSMVFALISSFLWILTTSYNIGYMRTLKEHAQTRYYICFGVAVFGAQGVAFSGNIFTLYLFYEIITLFTYPLVAHYQNKEAFEAGKKYLVYLLGTSKLFFLPAMIITYVLCGTLDFQLGDIQRGIFPRRRQSGAAHRGLYPVSGGTHQDGHDAPSQLAPRRPWWRPRRFPACSTRWPW
jgi:multicomponent Na+:H+ antiporter subunit D